MDFKKKIGLFVFSILGASTAMAGSATSLMQTAPVIAPGQYEMKLQSDIIFNSGGGLNISPHLHTGLVENFFDIDAFFGTGKTGFMIGATTKYNLLPDLPEQMGLSFLGGVAVLKDKPNNAVEYAKTHPDYNPADGLTRGLISLGIVASKDLQADFGTISPYAALQPEFLFRSDDSQFLLSLALGAHWVIANSAPWSFYTEFGLSLRKSLYMLALGAAYPF
ncbi:MAG: hypothetical protein ABIR96_05505 [Bdellovibrionota bacterium]